MPMKVFSILCYSQLAYSVRGLQGKQFQIHHKKQYDESMHFTAAGKYLGFFVGPGRGELSWDGPLAKFVKRAYTWSVARLGLQISLRAFVCYIASVLSYIWQLEDVLHCSRVLELRQECFRRCPPLLP